MDFSMRINIKKVGERYLITDDAGIRLMDTGLKGKEVWQHYFDVRHEQACEGKETQYELSNCIKPDVSVSLLKKYMAHVIDCEGIDYVDSIGYPPSDQKFTDEEQQLLKRLSEEISNER